ncbi:Fur family transcriptional regulator [Ottowia thiooxydans]|uniref:Fur family transcriptional regulator n=1 Tax=Ottowia thiooxydans TaxID=219182 RepID=UPI00040070C2|nr:Fur family transcriptional regulator [Ottowia thiooxydans]
MPEPAKSQAHELTKHQSLVLDALAREETPSSAYALLDQLRGEGLRAPQQVYRALDKLMEYGLVHRVESLNSFVACAHPHDHGHGHGTHLVVFAICDQCGHVDEFSDTAIDRRLKSWSRENSFKLNTAAVEMHGICSDCSLKPNSSEAPGGLHGTA